MYLDYFPEGSEEDLKLDSVDLQLEDHSGCHGEDGLERSRAEVEPAR